MELKVSMVTRMRSALTHWKRPLVVGYRAVMRMKTHARTAWWIQAHAHMGVMRREWMSVWWRLITKVDEEGTTGDRSTAAGAQKPRVVHRRMEEKREYREKTTWRACWRGGRDWGSGDFREAWSAFVRFFSLIVDGAIGAGEGGTSEGAVG